MKKLFLGLVLVSQVYCADKAEEIDFKDLFLGLEGMGITDSRKKPVKKSAALGVKPASGSIGKKFKQNTIKHYFKNKEERKADSALALLRARDAATKKAAELEEVLRFDLMNLDDE